MRTRGREFGPIPTVAELEAVADDLAQIAKDLNLARLDGFLRDAIEGSRAAATTTGVQSRVLINPAGAGRPRMKRGGS
jgi:hypothetical protein